jgi:CheY-like chemotaxis protein
MALTLRQSGHHVIEAEDGVEGMLKLSSLTLAHQPPHVVIADMYMGGVSGVTLVSGVRAAGYSSGIILVTAYPSDELRAAARSLRAQVLDKPIDPALLRATVSQLLRDEHTTARELAGAPTLLVAHAARTDVTCLVPILRREYAVRTTTDLATSIRYYASRPLAGVVCVVGGGWFAEQAINLVGARANQTVIVASSPDDLELCQRTGVRYLRVTASPDDVLVALRRLTR